MHVNFSLSKSVFLVGPMGVGKSTIGRQLADSLGFEFKDSDHEIEDKTGAKISLIFEIEGEEGFRKRERQMIAELTQMPKLVLATGGGAVLALENRQCLKRGGYVVYLRAAVEDLLERTALCRNRPLLQCDNPREKLEQILRDREALYKEVADVVINTGKRGIREVLGITLKRLKKLEES